MRLIRRPAALFLLTMAITGCLASGLSAQYRFESWTTENGLPQNSIWGIRQTRDGYLWMTTSSGMVRFDGLRFREFNRENTPGLNAEGFSAYALREDRQGCLWAGTNTSGVVRYCNGVFATFTTKDGLPGNRVVRIDEDDNGTVWFFTEPGLAKWKDGRIIRVAPEPNSPFNDVLTAPREAGVDGWMFGLWRIDKAGWQRFARGHWSAFPVPSAPSDGSGLHIDSIVEDSKERLWYRFKHDRATYYRLDKGRLTTFMGMPVERYISYQDSNGDLWESAHDGRVSLWKDGKVTPLDGFSTSYVFRGFEDREGSLWLGTSKQGLFRAVPSVITTQRNAGSPELNVVEPVMEDRAGGIWYGSFGLFHLSHGKLQAFYHLGAAPRANHAGGAQGMENIVSALFEDRDGTIWAGTWDGLAHRSGDVLLSDGPAASIRGRVNAIHRDRRGDLWIGCVGGLYRIRGTTMTRFTHADGLASDYVQVIREGRNGTLWIGTTAGLSARAGDTFSAVVAPLGPAQNITALYDDEEGVLWIGTRAEGLYRLEQGKVTHYAESNGLSTNSVFQIIEDGKGYFWLSSHTGIHRVKKQDLNAVAAGQQKSIFSTGFGKTDGMNSVECSSEGQPAGIKAKDGKLWFATTDGLAVLDPMAARTNVHPPPVLIEETSVDGLRNAVAGSATLKPTQSSLDIQYTALSFIKSSQIRFRYKMDGLDPDWIEAGSRRTAYYTRIPPGNYTFRVIAANSDGVWNMEGAQMAVNVLPPFYQTWWFRTLSSLTAIALVVIAWRLRVSQLEHMQAIQQAFSRELIASQEEERKRIAADLHDSLGQRLVIVKNLALFFLRAQGVEAVGSGKLRAIEEISDEAALAIDETREISYNLRPFQLDRLGLSKAIEAIVRTASEASETRFSVELDNIDDVFPEDLRINFYRIVQECLSNIVKHAQATEVSIEVKRTPDYLLFTARDNGRGFMPAAAKSETERGGFGLIGMSERARLLGGELTVQASPGRGTVISVRIDLREKS